MVEKAQQLPYSSTPLFLAAIRVIFKVPGKFGFLRSLFVFINRSQNTRRGSSATRYSWSSATRFAARLLRCRRCLGYLACLELDQRLRLRGGGVGDENDTSCRLSRSADFGISFLSIPS